MKNRKCPICDGPIASTDRRVKTCSAPCGYKYQAKQRRESMCPDKAEELVEESTVAGDTWTVTRKTDKPPRTEADVLRELNADAAEWAVPRWVAKEWEGYAKVKDRDGSERIQVVKLSGFTATLTRRTDVVHTKHFLERLYSEYRKKGPAVAKFKSNPIKKTGNLTILSVFDHHFGLQAWGHETGWPSYDLDSATEKWWEAVDRAAQRASIFTPEKIVLVLGGDLLHVDSRRNMTTAGTIQDVDSRYIKVYKHVRTTVADTATRLAANIAPVQVLCIPGNHDADSTLTMADALGCIFDGHKSVSIEQSPRSRKVIEWGINGLMVAHGDNASSQTKLKQLANVFAAEFPDVWGRTRVREVLTGHLHTEEVHDYHGCVVRRFPSLSPPSAWASGNHYVGSIRGAYGSTFHKTDGVIDLMRYTPREDLAA